MGSGKRLRRSVPAYAAERCRGISRLPAARKGNTIDRLRERRSSITSSYLLRSNCGVSYKVKGGTSPLAQRRGHGRRPRQPAATAVLSGLFVTASKRHRIPLAILKRLNATSMRNSPRVDTTYSIQKSMFSADSDFAPGGFDIPGGNEQLDHSGDPNAASPDRPAD
jgi:hypothetical protein